MATAKSILNESRDIERAVALIQLGARLQVVLVDVAGDETVRDTGAGIPSEKLSQIFSRVFF